MNIGANLKRYRKKQGLTLSALADISGIQVATLSRIENLKMTGTLESHIKIAKALKIEITDLYNSVIREETKLEENYADNTTDVFIHNNQSSYEILTNRVRSKKMTPILLKIEAEGQTNREQNKGGVEKFIYVLEGDIEIQIEENTYP